MNNEVKEYADKLIEKYLEFTPAESEYEIPYAKQCALLEVESNITLLKNTDALCGIHLFIDGYEFNKSSALDFLQQVKEYLK